MFNRPGHTLRTLSALQRNDLAKESKLYIFCDGPRAQKDEKGVSDVRALVRQEPWCRQVEIFEQDSNLGLATSIRNGISSVLTEHESIIVLEDDIETAPQFLRYMNHSLAEYKHDKYVTSVCSYVPDGFLSSILPPTFLVPFMSCWGWGTWRRSWDLVRWDAKELLKQLAQAPGGLHRFNLDGTCNLSKQLEDNLNGRLKTWAIFWAASTYLSNGNSLYPRKSLSRNCGFDSTGENCHSNDAQLYDVKLPNRYVLSTRKQFKESWRGRLFFKDFYSWGKNKNIKDRLKLVLGLAKHRIVNSLMK